MNKNVLADPLDGTYWTPVPYKLGPKVAKYMVEPCQKAPAPETKPMASDHYLRENLIQHNRYSDSCFKFKMQIQTNNNEMPIEKATVLWDPKKSPFVEIARIDIRHGQSVDHPARVHLCEHLSMTGWHSLPEHAPLGQINLARKSVYQRISKHRHRENGVPEFEPGVIGPQQ